MSTLARSVTRVNLAPTVAAFGPGGVPKPPVFVNSAAKAPHDAHSHHGPSSARSDIAPKWAGEVKLTSGFNGLVARTQANGGSGAGSVLPFRIVSAGTDHL